MKPLYASNITILWAGGFSAVPAAFLVIIVLVSVVSSRKEDAIPLPLLLQ